MLSRTANNLFWMARYVERAENTARILDVTYRMSLMPQDPKLVTQEWFAPLNITGDAVSLQRALQHRERARRAALHGAGPGQSLQHLLLRPRRA